MDGWKDGWMMRGFMNLIEREGCGEGERGWDVWFV